MSLSADLLLQAQHLASMDRGKPRQASLRRAVSAAYYAMFHLLVSESVRRLSPTSPAGLSLRVARAYVHDEMKQVCKSISEGKPSQILLDLHPDGFSASLRHVAFVFVVLQEARHRADYDLAAAYTRSEVLGLLDEAEDAIKAWRQVRARDEATVFLTALLLARKWSR